MRVIVTLFAPHLLQFSWNTQTINSIVYRRLLTSQKSVVYVKFLDARRVTDTKNVPYWEHTNIRHQRTKFGRPGDLTAWICAPLRYVPVSRTEFHPDLTLNLENVCRRPFTRMRLTASILTKLLFGLEHFVHNSCNEFHENSTKCSVSVTKSRRGRSSSWRRAFFFYTGYSILPKKGGGVLYLGPLNKPDSHQKDMYQYFVCLSHWLNQVAFHPSFNLGLNQGPSRKLLVLRKLNFNQTTDRVQFE